MSTESGPKLRLLVVDDDGVLTRILAKYLGAHGFDVVVATSPFGVMKLAIRHAPDLVVLDLNMPGLAGGDLVKLFRKSERLASTPVLFYTADDSMDDARAHELGASGCLHKDGDLELLVAAIRRCIGVAGRSGSRLGSTCVSPS